MPVHSDDTFSSCYRFEFEQNVFVKSKGVEGYISGKYLEEGVRYYDVALTNGNVLVKIPESDLHQSFIGRSDLF